jgi:hypothetical protein
VTTPVRQRVAPEAPPPLFLDATAAAIVAAVRGLGFTDRDQLELSDRPIQGLVYVSRVHEGQHQYVSLITYDGTFCQAVIEVFAQPKDTRKPKRPLYCDSARTLSDIVVAVSAIYPPLTPS